LTKVVVAGAGLIGLLTARELIKSGLDVILLDKGRAGSESSWAGGGILSPLYPWRYPQPVLQLARIGHHVYESLAQSLQDESGFDPEWTKSGMLILDENEAVAAKQWSDQSGISCHQIESPRLTQLEPALSTDYQQALWLPDVAQVRNPRLIKTVRQSIISLGVDLREGVEVKEVVHESGKVRGVKTNNGLLSADRVVIAGGAWSAGMLSSLGINIKVEPVRGQMLLFKTRPGMIKQIILDQGYYLIPRRDGRVLMGSTMEYVGFDKSTTQAAFEELVMVAKNMIPDLADCEIETQWAGLRPGSPSGIPYIGEHPDIDGLYVNTGHFRNGVILAPASCQLLADLVLGRETEVDPAPYALMAEH